MSVRLLVFTPFSPKKSMRMICDADEVFPIAIWVNQPPPIATSGKTKEPAPPMVSVAGTDEVLVDGGGWRVIRRRQTIDDMISLESV